MPKSHTTKGACSAFAISFSICSIPLQNSVRFNLVPSLLKFESLWNVPDKGILNRFSTTYCRSGLHGICIT